MKEQSGKIILDDSILVELEREFMLKAKEAEKEAKK